MEVNQRRFCLLSTRKQTNGTCAKRETVAIIFYYYILLSADKKTNKKTPVLEGVKTKFIALIILFLLLCAVKILP